MGVLKHMSTPGPPTRTSFAVADQGVTTPGRPRDGLAQGHRSGCRHRGRRGRGRRRRHHRGSHRRSCRRRCRVPPRPRRTFADLSPVSVSAFAVPLTAVSTTSVAPGSHAAPAGRATPRWSTGASHWATGTRPLQDCRRRGASSESVRRSRRAARVGATQERPCCRRRRRRSSRSGTTSHRRSGRTRGDHSWNLRRAVRR